LEIEPNGFVCAAKKIDRFDYNLIQIIWNGVRFR